MSKLTEYRVLRNHEGDRFYSEGETRMAPADEVKHLVGTVLAPVVQPAPAKKAPAKKKAAPVANKAEGASSSNKAAPRRKTKG